MATRRCFAALIHRRARSLLTSTTSFDPLKTIIPQPFDLPVLSPPSIPLLGSRELQCFEPLRFCSARCFSSKNSSSGDVDDDVDSDEEEEEDDDEDEEDESDPDDEDDGAPASKVVDQQGKTEAEKVEEAAEIGYKVIGHLGPSEFPFKAYEPVFAVVQVGSHQFKVSNGDSIFTEKLKYCDVNDKLILTKVLMLGSKNQTVIGRPILPEAAVHAVVEEHALDAKVIIFKKKRRKNYRRTKGHRQELTKLRITDIQGIDKSDIVRSRRKKKAKPENEAVAA